MLRSRKRLGMLLLGAVAVVAAGCSSAGGGNTGASVNSSNSATAIGKKINIAISSPESGAGAYAAAYAQGLQGYLSYVNGNGGINGYTFTTTIVDNAGTAAGGAEAIRQILQSPPALAAVIGSSSYQSSVAIVKAQDPNLPFVDFGNAALVRKSGLPDAFGFFPNYVQECRFQAQFALNTLKATNLALLYEDSSIGVGPAGDCPAYGKAQGAATFDEYAVPTPTVSTNYAPIVAKLATQKPQATLFFGSNTELVGIQKAALAIGLKTKFIGLATSFDPTTYFGLAGAAGNGTYFDAFSQPINSGTAAANLFRSQMAKFAPSANNTLGGYGWSYGAIIAQAVKNATDGGKTLTNASFAAALKGLNTGALGLLYSVDYAKDVSTVAGTLSVYQATNGSFAKVANDLPIPAGP